MNLKTAIARFDTLYPNSVPYEEKVAWVAELDGLVLAELVCAQGGTAPEGTELPYTLATPGSTVLLLPFPYDTLYVEYLSMKTELLCGDITRYNNASTLVARTYEAFCHYYTRTHLPPLRTSIRV